MRACWLLVLVLGACAPSASLGVEDLATCCQLDADATCRPIPACICAQRVLERNPSAAVVPCTDPACPPATANACTVVCLTTGAAWGCCPGGEIKDHACGR